MYRTKWYHMLCLCKGKTVIKYLWTYSPDLLQIPKGGIIKRSPKSTKKVMDQDREIGYKNIINHEWSINNWNPIRNTEYAWMKCHLGLTLFVVHVKSLENSSLKISLGSEDLPHLPYFFSNQNSHQSPFSQSYVSKKFTKQCISFTSSVQRIA